MKLILGDSLEILKKATENSIDSIVCDPPYELGFMGKSWDSTGIAYNVELWKGALRVLKPGGHLLAFGGSRTYHRLAVAIEDAGFTIRDQMMWIYGSGFPKSLDVSKAIDKAAGMDRKIIGKAKGTGKQNPLWNGMAAGRKENSLKPEYNVTEPASLESAQWNGWGTALKPAHEPIVVARKPLSEKTVAANVLRWGTGALNIDASRIGSHSYTQEDWDKKGLARKTGNTFGEHKPSKSKLPQGRFPANILFDEEAGEMLDEQSGVRKSGAMSGSYKGTTKDKSACFGEYGMTEKNIQASAGGASRFFYCAKTPKKERGEGNNHPTVKPLTLMRYLVRLVTPPNGKVLDPFMGSGSTGIAAKLEGFDFVGIEKEQEYFTIAENRIGEAK